jgi:lipoprotein-releasing system ATP-binding protein
MRNEEIGFIFQFSNLIPELTALENVMLPGMIGKKNGFDLRKKAIDRLTQVGLSSKARSGASTLSGGEMQRVAIARSLINDPSLVLADEPTGNLDSKNSEELINLMRDLNKKNNQTFAIISHDHKIVAKCDRVIRIRDGMIEDQEDDVGSSDVTSTGDKSLNDKKTLEKLREENKILRTRLGKLEQKRR